AAFGPVVTVPSKQCGEERLDSFAAEVEPPDQMMAGRISVNETHRSFAGDPLGWQSRDRPLEIGRLARAGVEQGHRKPAGWSNQHKGAVIDSDVIADRIGAG